MPVAPSNSLQAVRALLETEDQRDSEERTDFLIRSLESKDSDNGEQDLPKLSMYVRTYLADLGRDF